MSRAPARPVHLGVVHAAAFVIEREPERRLLALSARAEVYQLGDAWLARLIREEPVRTAAAPGAPLVRDARGFLVGGPFRDAELDALGAPRGAVVVARGGSLVWLEAGPSVDLSAWLDLDELEVLQVSPLGAAPQPPTSVAAPIDGSVREALHAPPAAATMLRELERLRELARDERVAPRGGRPGWPWAGLTRLFAALSALLGVATSRARSVDGQRACARSEPARPSWLARLAERLRELSLGLLQRTGMLRRLAHRQGEYVARLLDMLEREDWGAALRHAIPLGGEAEAQPRLGLLPPRPRTDLAFGEKRSGGAAMLFGGDLYGELRTRYRRAFERLDHEGRHREAAFVLAELLGSSEEAVSYLERHGLVREAAELAELRALPPALLVRQWMLAGEIARAVQLARRHACFAEAITRLDTTGRKAHASVLRLLHADLLADAGSFAAAVDVVWPFEDARKLTEVWIDRAVELGGPSGARMLVHKLLLAPSSFGEVCAAAVGLLGSDESHEDGAALALGEALARAPATAETLLLSRATARALLARGDGPDDAQRQLAARLVTASDDELLRADLAACERRARPARDAWGEVLCRSLRGPADNAASALVVRHEPSQTVRLDHQRVLGGFAVAVFDATTSRCAERLGAELVGSAGGGSFDPKLALTRLGDAIYRENTANRTSHAASVAAVAFDGHRVVVAHAGDCRVYLVRSGEVTALTKDHTLDQRFPLAAGELTHDGVALPEDVSRERAQWVLLRVLGLTLGTAPEVAREEVARGDRLLLCTDGFWRAIDPKALEEHLRRPSASPRSRLDELTLLAAGGRTPRESSALALVDFGGADLPSAAPGAPAGKTLTRPSHDVGSLPVFDALALPRGRLLVALGEAGIRLVGADGRTVAHFLAPAHELVAGDSGDRAIALARRGEVTRLTRVNLFTSQAEDWCDARVGAHADTFDGAAWFVADGGVLHGIDALDSGWSSLWRFDDPAGFSVVTRSRESLLAVTADPAGAAALRFELPSMTLRSRSPLPTPADPKDSAGQSLEHRQVRVVAAATGELFGSGRGGLDWSHGGARLRLDPRFEAAALSATRLVGHPDGEPSRLEVIDVERGERLVSLELGGATRARARFSGRLLLVWDDRGRVLAIDPGTGALAREWRLT